MKPYERLLKHLNGREAAPDDFLVPDPGNSAQILALEQRYGLSLPDDFRDYLIHCAPEGEWMDAQVTTWWEVARIRNIPDEYPHPIKEPEVSRDAADYLFFADHAIWCMAWAIGCGTRNRGRIFVFSDKERFVADSFGEFVDLYITDPTSVL